MDSCDVSVIIVNFNTKELLEKCLESVFIQTHGLKFEVLVVDNASNDGSQHMIATNFPQVKLIANVVNYGFGKANNIGIKEATGTYVLFLNSDTILMNNAVKIFFSFLAESKDASIAALGSVLYDQNLNFIHSYGLFPKPVNDLFQRCKGLILKMFGLKSNPFNKKNPTKNMNSFICKEVEYITGADLFMPRELFISLNGFDETFFMYYEETELQWRMSLKHYKRLIITGPQIIHLESKSFKISNQKRIMVNVSYLKYLDKHYPKIAKCTYKCCFMILIIVEMLMDVYWREFSLQENICFLKKNLHESY